MIKIFGPLPAPPLVGKIGQAQQRVAFFRVGLENFFVAGKFSGYISNMTYFSYALTYSEIQTQLNIGPSSQFDQDSMDKPPYLIDTWWTQRAT